jgi:hypothetical protein
MHPEELERRNNRRNKRDRPGVPLLLLQGFGRTVVRGSSASQDAAV